MLVKLIEASDNLDFVVTYNKALVANYSEEDVSSWIRYFSNPVVLKPQTQPLQTPIGKVSNWREIEVSSFNSKKCRSWLSLFFNPTRSSIYAGIAGGQVAVGIVAVTKVNVIFSVKGEAIRKGEIVDALGEGNKVRIFFKNTGSVTMKVVASGEIYHNNKTYSFSSARETVKTK